MKTILTYSTLILLLLLTSCEGSDTYRGSWKALTSQGDKTVITFSPDKMNLKTESGEEASYDYTQNGFHFLDGKHTYDIKLKNGLGYQITFPLKGNKEKGYIADEFGNILYVIGKKDYCSDEDIHEILK